MRCKDMFLENHELYREETAMKLENPGNNESKANDHRTKAINPLGKE